MELPMQVKQLCGPPGVNEATPVVAHSVASGPGVCTSELSGAVDLFAAAKVFRSAGLHAAARRIENRARRTPLPRKVSA